MKNLKAHHHLAIVSLLLFGVVSVWGWGSLVFANTSNTTINVTVGPPDACSNIAGYQSSVPTGMTVDSSGNCYTPPPPPVDVCNNLDGNQEAVPSGYYRDASGACRPQPARPMDVCPNLSGTQEVVPEGYRNDESGACVLPPADMCLNIDGVQEVVPEGMTSTDTEGCFTPPAPAAPAAPTKLENPWTAPVKPRTSRTVQGSADLKNIPAALDGAVAPIVAAIPVEVKEALRSVPPVVAQTFPYYTFAVLAAAAAVMGWQAISEIRSSRFLLALIKRERDVAEEKDNFISLASHYLRTPLTIMKGALDTSIAVKELDQESAAPLRQSMETLDTNISATLADVESNAALKNIVPPQKAEEKKPNFLKSAFFWIPVGATIVIVWMSNFLLGVVGEVELGTYNLIAQAGTYLAVSMLFYSAVRTRYIQRQERAYHETLLRHEEVIDTARNEFIAEATAALSGTLVTMAAQRTIMAGLKTEALFNDGFERFDHLLNKFNLLSQIQAGVVGATEHFDLKTAIDEIIRFYQPQLDARQLTIINNIGSANVKQRRSLFDFVLNSLIDNAIKFSNEGGTITINANPHDANLTLSITDHGIGIPEEKMSQLFKPFSRGTSAMEFNYEGLGFSLFLDKIIMDYVGGDIAAKSAADEGTTFTVTANLGGTA